jgi:outer membrane protein assembly factor BamE (lipoprotein component of BamABCDE complex)
MLIRSVLNVLIVLGLCVSCSSVIRNHGHIPLPSDLEKIKIGLDNKQSVQKLIGQPTTSGVLKNRSWYYVGSTVRHYGWKEPEEINRMVISISFNKADVVENIQRFSLSDGKDIKISSRMTKKKIKDNTFIRQLLGNFGRIDLPSVINDN